MTCCYCNKKISRALQIGQNNFCDEECAKHAWREWASWYEIKNREESNNANE